MVATTPGETHVNQGLHTLCVVVTCADVVVHTL